VSQAQVQGNTRCRLIVRSIFLALMAAVFHEQEQLAAQVPLCPGACGSDIQVTPKGAQASAPANSTGQLLTFTVENIGTVGHNVTFSCPTTSPITCTNLSHSSYSFDPSEQIVVTATYSTGVVGAGSLTLAATGTASDNGWYDLLSTGPAAPVISMAPQNTTYRDAGKCVASCFDGVYAHSTPAYFSLNSARSLTLAYNSQTQKPTPLVWADVSLSAGATLPTTYSIQVRRVGAGTWMTLLNGSTIAYYSPHSSGLTRLAAALDAATNQIDSTGVFDLEVSVLAYYGGTTLGDTATTQLLINSQSRSAFGAGFDLAGYQRLYKRGSAAGDVVITEGDGSIAFYDSVASGYTRPAGAPAVRLVYQSGNPASSRYTRTYLDGSYLQFNDKGYLTKAADRYGTATTFAYYTAPFDTLLSTVTDPMGKVITLCYNAGCTATNAKLHHVNVLSGPALRTVTYTSSSGKLTQIQDPDGYSETLAYGANGLLSSVTDRAGQVSELYYDGMNLLDSLRAPSITLFDGTTGRPRIKLQPAERAVWQPATAGTSIGSPKGGVKADTSLKLIITDPLGAVVKMSQDRFGSPVTIIDPFGALTLITRDTHGRPTWVTEPGGRYQTYVYNNYGQLTSRGGFPSGQNASFYYKDTLSTDLKYVDGDRVRTDFHYYGAGDPAGPVGALKDTYVGVTAVWPATTGGSLLGTHKVDGLGRDTAVVDPLNHGTRFTFDGTWGNLLKVKAPDNTETRVTLDAFGRPDSSIAPAAAATKTAYGLMNQVLSQTWGSPGFRVTNTYDPATLALVRVETPRVGGMSSPVVNKFAYNALGALIRQHDAADTTKADTIKYDLGGALRRLKTRRGDQIDMTYDKAGRLLSRSGPGFPTDNFVYDTVIGAWQVAYNSVARDSVHFDTRGRLDVWRQTLNGRTYTGTLTYDGINRVTRRVLTPSSPAADSAVMQYVYATGTGVRDSICVFANPKRCVTMHPDADFGPDTVHFNKGTADWWLYREIRDANHRTTSVYYPGNNNLTPFDIGLVYDSVGRNTRRNSPKGAPYNQRKFTYDALGRLVNACDSLAPNCQNVVNGTGSAAWAYDSAGNRDQIGVTETYGAGNRLTALGTTSLGYDALGGLICRIVGTCPSGTGIGYKYSWDALGRLKGIRNGSTGALVDSMFYDALGRRVRKQTAAGDEYYVYEGEQVIFDVNASGTILREYAWQPGTIDQMLAMRSTTPVFDTLAAIVDPLNGTVRGMASFRTGMKVKEYNEYPWGDAVADTGIVVRYRFAGREYDSESGLYYMRARYYDPATGRWISEDPIGIEGGGNLYAYAGNDPVNFSDPSGLGPCKWAMRWIDGAIESVLDCDAEKAGGPGGAGGITIYLGPGTGGGGPPGSSFPRAPAGPGSGGGSGGSTSQSTERNSCPAIPPAPDDASVAENVRAIQQSMRFGTQAGTAVIFYDLVNNGGGWDYKKNGHPEYDPFGNFSYGATGTAVGFSANILHRMAGYVAETSDSGRSGKASLWRAIFGKPYPDSQADSIIIAAGIQYTRNKCYSK